MYLKVIITIRRYGAREHTDLHRKFAKGLESFKSIPKKNDLVSNVLDNIFKSWPKAFIVKKRWKSTRRTAEVVLFQLGAYQREFWIILTTRKFEMRNRKEVCNKHNKCWNRKRLNQKRTSVEKVSILSFFRLPSVQGDASRQ